MKSEGFNAHSKYMILKHALKENNVSHTCKLFSISRTTFYNWYRAYQKYGMTGLKNKEPQKPKMPNKVSKSVEHEILAYVESCPADGPKRIYYELKSEGLSIGESGIYNVLKRHNLSRKAQRVIYSKNKKLHINGKQNKKQLMPPINEHKEAAYPGDFIIQRIDFIGRFDGIGKIYQYSFYDVYSKLGVVKLYNKKQDIDVWYFFQLKIVYLLKTFNLKIDNLITKKTKEFIPYFIKGNKYKEVTENLNIKHCFIENEKSTLMNAMDEFNEYLVKEFYSKIGADKSIDSFVKIERAFHKFLRHYNFSRTISSGSNYGKTPAEVILERAAENNVDFDTLPLWILALLNQTKRVD
ncbi:helix-turn-helix domain-containing protein [Alkaliphilus peptidifermentans]|uniref:Helix-turn-helix domain-containing protein n=1 Tax=Alkaliphilus peptidifermentans DSM 18978 TaxID=1120976 RepID=A0A1G5IKV7_9FIRM|nr:helix-turn-helix domain-containing protein [Alkaliphilus peptidifermentans]SCY76340.1 Helix-turn-helix domain-containing protein [Alkaliphilus peptidifermentans DSM 18978]